jgi:hypothetical protein
VKPARTPPIHERTTVFPGRLGGGAHATKGFSPS